MNSWIWGFVVGYVLAAAIILLVKTPDFDEYITSNTKYYVIKDKNYIPVDTIDYPKDSLVIYYTRTYLPQK